MCVDLAVTVDASSRVIVSPVTAVTGQLDIVAMVVSRTFSKEVHSVVLDVR